MFFCGPGRFDWREVFFVSVRHLLAGLFGGGGGALWRLC